MLGKLIKQELRATSRVMLPLIAAVLVLAILSGISVVLLDRELDLPAQGLSALVLVALGYRSASDFNARLPKSRLPASRQITRL